MLFFTADPHFGHLNIIKYCYRPFSDENEMDRALTENWNSVVKNEDEVFILGDIAMTQNADRVYNYLRRLNGKKHVILGNHDSCLTRNREKFEKILLSITSQKTIDVDGTEIIMTHHPRFTYEECFSDNVWHLFGHIHNNAVQNAVCNLMPNNLNVGVDCCNYRPISFDEVKSRIQKRNRFLNEENCLKITSLINECLPDHMEHILRNS